MQTHSPEILARNIQIITPNPSNNRHISTLFHFQRKNMQISYGSEEKLLCMTLVQWNNIKTYVTN